MRTAALHSAWLGTVENQDKLEPRGKKEGRRNGMNAGRKEGIQINTQPSPTIPSAEGRAKAVSLDCTRIQLHAAGLVWC